MTQGKSAGATPQVDSRYLLSEHPLLVYPTLARAIGLNQAIVVQQIRFWITQNSRDPDKKNSHFREGRWWTYNTLSEWQKVFCWQSLATTKRVFSDLCDRGILLKAALNSDPMNRTMWYSIDFAALDRAVEEAEAQASGRSSQSETDHSVKMSQCMVSSGANDLYTETSYKDFSTNKDLNTYKAFRGKNRKTDNVSLNGTPSTCFSDLNSRKNSSCQMAEEVSELPNPQPPSSAAPPSPKKSLQRPQRSPVLAAKPGEVIQLPSRGRFMLPGRLALRSAQIELSYLHLGFEFWQESPDSVFVRDSHESEDWENEDDMFSVFMPMTKLVTLLETDQYGAVGVDVVNETITRWFEFWLAKLEATGSVLPKGGKLSVFPEVARSLDIEMVGDEYAC